MIDREILEAVMKICKQPNLDALKRAAVVVAQIEAANRSEPGSVAPRLAAYVRRRPSELSPTVSSVMLDGFIFQVELENNQAATLSDLTKAGENPFNAKAMFQETVLWRKWELMASLVGEVEE
jgi:hypothetical protein